MNKLTMLAINDEGIAFDPGSGESYILNQTGLFILKAMKGHSKDEDIIKTVCNEFDVSSENAQTDIIDFKDTLAKLGLKTE